MTRYDALIAFCLTIAFLLMLAGCLASLDCFPGGSLYPAFCPESTPAPTTFDQGASG